MSAVLIALARSSSTGAPRRRVTRAPARLTAIG
jgi:hypothetical protein